MQCVMARFAEGLKVAEVKHKIRSMRTRYDVVHFLARLAASCAFRVAAQPFVAQIGPSLPAEASPLSDERLAWDLVLEGLHQ